MRIIQPTIITLILIISGFQAISQVNVDLTKSITAAVQSLAGPGVTISNISWSVPPGSPTPPIAYFEDLTNYTGLNKGLLLTTGGAKLAEGPNDADNITQVNNSFYMYDPDLNPYAYLYNLYDISYVQFDIVTYSNTLSFDYVFASDEYTEWTDYSDVFALMISGPGIVGNQNLAIVPGTTLPVSVTNLNNYTNSTYYRNNYSNSYLQYDGLTVPLVASTTVIPCQTYKIKLAIADYRDPYWDSGVFIKQGSFKSEAPPIVTLTYEHPELSSVIESCNKATIKVERPAGAGNTDEGIYEVTLYGTATNGTDYSFINNSVTILAGDQEAFLTIDPITDTNNEGEEIIWIRVGNECATPIPIPLNDRFPYRIPQQAICLGDSVQLNKNPDINTSIVWESNSSLSCTNCLSPYAKPDTTNYFSYTITHNTSGCQALDSVLVEAVHIVPDFSFYSDQCYTSYDITFKNESSKASEFLWDFGDGETSTDANPVHTYPYNHTRGNIDYTVKLVARSSSPAVCSKDTIKIVTISDPLFIPNLLTADGNEKNDEFKVSGIGGECWTLYLYDRWGGLIYQKENYTNEFKGKNMEAGAYYYVIENNNKDRSFRGWLHIVK